MVEKSLVRRMAEFSTIAATGGPHPSRQLAGCGPGWQTVNGMLTGGNRNRRANHELFVQVYPLIGGIRGVQRFRPVNHEAIGGSHYES